MWPQLREARNKAQSIEATLAQLLKEQTALQKKEIAAQRDQLLSEIDAVADEIALCYNELVMQLKSHRKQVAAKARFLGRHHSRNQKI